MLIRGVYGEQKSDSRAYDGENEAEQNGLIRAFFHSFGESCAEILGVETYHCSAECRERRHCEVYEFVRRAHAVLSGVAHYHKSVGKKVEFDGFGKHYDKTYRQHGKLKSEGYALLDVRPNILPRNLEILLFKAQKLVFYKRINEARYRAKHLSEYGCARRARNAPFEHFDKKQVEGDVHNRGYEKEQ